MSSSVAVRIHHPVSRRRRSVPCSPLVSILKHTFGAHKNQKTAKQEKGSQRASVTTQEKVVVVGEKLRQPKRKSEYPKNVVSRKIAQVVYVEVYKG